MSAISGFTKLPNSSQLQEEYDLSWNTTLDELGTFATELKDAAIAMNLNDTNSVSTTSLTIGFGTKNLTVETAKSYLPGMAVNIGYTTDGANYMRGVVKTYNSGNGALSVQVTETAGAGTFATWSISHATPINMLPGSLVLLDTVSASAAGQVDVENGFDQYSDCVIACDDMSVSTLEMRVQMKIGGTYLSSGYTYADVGAAISGSSTYIRVIESASFNDARFALRLFDVQSTTRHKMLQYYLAGMSSAGVLRGSLIGHGAVQASNTALQGVRIFPAAGTVTGNFKLYGVIS